MTEHNYEQMRRAMVVGTLRTTGVNDPRVLAAMGDVPRERFVPETNRAIAYADTIVLLGRGRYLNSPIALGKLLVEAAPREGERALVIGAATGYSAAVMARLVGQVVAVEEEPELAAAAKAALAGSGVQLVEGPLAKGYKRGAPYDMILIDGAVEIIPDPLVDQLADGGRIAAAIVEDGVQRLAIGRRAGGGFGVVTFADVASAPLPGFERPRGFTF